ncbi:YcaO-like family protein [Devriesea agamarum]|uniref:YcaO-like family protein n=1 Tax=Devriesea agamarum TaxID=472569 RepID=UPI00155EE574|nr:YcaO-like family protein [Devriesea agamarum]
MSPVHAVIGSEIDVDVTGLVTAKVSGYLVLYFDDDYYTRPWGGHCANLGDALYLGILEGVERLSCESPPDAAVVREPPPGIRVVGLDEYGVPAEHWKIANPNVGAWAYAHVIEAAAPQLLGEKVLTPERLVFTRPSLDHIPWVQDSSNGCAVGGSDVEAILFGMLEAIERDAFMIAWYGKLSLAPIDPSSIKDEESRAYLQRMALCDVNVVFLDATVGVSVPTVIAVCSEPSGATCVGAGSHPDPERALKSALVEVASDFQIVAERGRSRAEEIDSMLADYSKVRAMEDHADLFATIESQPLIAHWRNPRLKPVSLDSLRLEYGGGSNVGSDLSSTIQACHDAGFQPLAVDMRSELLDRMGLSCWKVVIPGLIPIDFGPYQRATRMPRLAERIARVTGDSSSFRANPVPHPFP